MGDGGALFYVFGGGNCHFGLGGTNSTFGGRR
jgi:hypothetical protein